MDLVTRVQIQDKSVCISANDYGKDQNKIILSPSMGK